MAVNVESKPEHFDAQAAAPLDASVDAAARAASNVALTVAGVGSDVRAAWLDAVAEAVEADADALTSVADQETGLGLERLSGEVARCAAQLRFYGVVAREGSWLEAAIDHATDATPDLRRIRRSLGPVAVFGASNFPFAFGSLGNDTGSAIAAGCPVIVKGHPAHPRTHARLLSLAREALLRVGAPVGTLGDVTGLEAGQALVLHPAVRAVAFTGSQKAGLALHRLTQTREVVIPVYAEMGTVNPVVVTQAAASSKAQEVAAGCVGSFTLGMGQFCTKPGLLLVPSGSQVPSLIAQALTSAKPRGPMLTDGIAQGYGAGLARLLEGGAKILASTGEPDGGTPVAAMVLLAPAEMLTPGSPALDECFGPVIVVVEYTDARQREELLRTMQGALVGSVMSGGPNDPEVGAVVDVLAAMAGRVTVDAWPTGVSTTWAQHHGGPWPATSNPATTSVGAAALARFTRPVAYQGVPRQALPVGLRDQDGDQLPRRVDGAITLPGPAR